MLVSYPEWSYNEPPEVEKRFHEKTSGRTASPKVWVDAWLLALAQASEGVRSRLTKRLIRGARTACCPDEGNASEVNETGDQTEGLSFLAKYRVIRGRKKPQVPPLRLRSVEKHFHERSAELHIPRLRG